MHINRMITGMVASSAAAKRYCHSIMLNELNCVMPTVIGLFAGVEMSTVEIVYSFHELMNTKISVVTMPGAAIGSRMCQSAPTVLHPSMQAACSISGEIETNVPRSSQMANAWLNAALMSMSPKIVSFKCSVFISWEMPTSSTTGENIWLMMTKPRNRLRPLKFMRAIA